MKICKDGRIWGQNNKDAGSHLGIQITTSRIKIKGKYIKKGYNMNSVRSGKLSNFYGVHRYGKDAPAYGVHLFGKNSSNWKGGITPLNHQIRNLSEFKQWRSEVFQRDNWTCQTCQARSGEGKAIILNAHHIKPLIQILRDNHITTAIEAQLCKGLWNVNNGITLCEKCHNLTKKGRRGGK